MLNRTARAHRQYSPLPELYAEVDGVDGELVDFLNFRDIDCVYSHSTGFTDIVGETRNRRDKAAAVVVGLAVDGQEISTNPPAISELELVTHTGELCPIAPGVFEKSGFDSSYAQIVIVELVVNPKPDIEFVVQVTAVGAFPIGVVRDSEDVQIEFEPGLAGRTSREASTFAPAEATADRTSCEDPVSAPAEAFPGTTPEYPGSGWRSRVPHPPKARASARVGSDQ